MIREFPNGDGGVLRSRCDLASPFLGTEAKDRQTYPPNPYWGLRTSSYQEHQDGPMAKQPRGDAIHSVFEEERSGVHATSDRCGNHVRLT